MLKRFIPAAFALCLGAGAGIALAQPNESPSEVPGNEAYYFAHPCERPGPYDALWYRRCAEFQRKQAYPGAGPDRDLRIDQHIPRGMLHRQYSIDNWRAHRLPPPPAGYAWYQVGADYVLVERATGRIAQTRVAR